MEASNKVKAGSIGAGSEVKGEPELATSRGAIREVGVETDDLEKVARTHHCAPPASFL